MKPPFRTFCLIVALQGAVMASGPEDALDGVREWRRAHESEIVDELVEFVRIPNESRDEESIRRNARRLAELMEKRGLAPRLLATGQFSPVVYGEWLVPGATSTYVFYAHYDGQPVGDVKEWADLPFSGAIRDGAIEAGGRNISLPTAGGSLNPDWRIYGRGAADDKAGIMTILNAVSAMRAVGQEPRANLKFVFEGEEETGSEHLEAILRENGELLQSDGWIVCDTPVHSSGRQNVIFGVRGVYAVELTVHTAARNLHSGQFGNWAPNAAMELAQLLATMKDQQGRILVPGFYEAVLPLGESELQAVALVPDNDLAQQRSIMLGRLDGGGSRLAELINLPTLNVAGLTSGKVGGQVSTIIPASATAAMDIRLVKGTTRAGTLAALKSHIEAQGYRVVDRAPTDDERLANPRLAELRVIAQGYEAARVSMNSSFSRRVVEAVRSVKPDLLSIPSSGGSLPLEMIERVLGSPFVMVGISNPDNNQHTKNENIRLGQLWEGIEVYVQLLRMR